MEIIVPLFFMFFGLFLVIFNKKISCNAAERWERAVKLRNPFWPFNTKNGFQRLYQIPALIGGLVFVAFGLLSLLGIIKIR